MTTGHAQDAEQPETGITPGDKGAFRDVLSKDHARRGQAAGASGGHDA